MHRVLASHIKAFKESHSLTLSEARLFEAFSAFTVCSVFSSDEQSPDDLIYDQADPGIDSVLFFVNDRCLLTIDEFEETFKSKKNDNDITIVFVQSTAAEKWDKQKLNSFESAIMDFISDSPHHDYGEYLKEKKLIFDYIIENLGKIKGGKPQVRAYFACSAGSDVPKEIDSARKVLEKQLQDSGLFLDAKATLLGWESLVSLYLSATGTYDAKFSIIGAASFPKSPGIEESYVVTVSAKAFASSVLKDPQGNLRRSVFEDNVRDFIEFSESSINTRMRSSLVNADSTRRFGILNNGITVISPDVRLQSNELFISNYQIVNGCQTSNVLFDALAEIGDDATLMVKIIETNDQEIVSEIVESTNSQNKIEDYQFLARLECVKGIERYFRVRADEAEQALYFERRPNQYNGQGYPAIRIFDIRETARCCGAMFFDRPDLSARYPGQLVEELSSKVFSKSNKEEIFFASAYAYYRLRLHLSNQRIDPIFNSMKWHALMGIKYIVCGLSVPAVTSSKIEPVCDKIIKFMSKSDPDTMAVWKELATKLKQLPYNNRDDLRRTKLTNDLKQLLA